MRAYDRLLVEDRAHLMAQPQFRRLLFEIYSAAGITRFTREEQQSLFHEGRRSLGLEILGWFAASAAEPDDAILAAITARMEHQTQGAKHDDRDDYPRDE